MNNRHPRITDLLQFHLPTIIEYEIIDDNSKYKERRSQMKKKFTILFILFVSISFVAFAFAQTKEEIVPLGSTEKAEGQDQGVEKKVSSKPKGLFVGDVVSVDPDAMTITVHQKVGTPGERGTVTFDIKNVQFKGYKGIADIKVGDKVAVKYTKDGTEVKKIKATKKAG